MSLFGTDQSKWQSDEVKEGDFVILKATEGVGYVDPTCDTKYQLNKKAGKLLGVYHYARPDLNDAVSEARFFAGSVKGYLNEAILALDWEQPGTQNNVAWAKAWLDEVYKLTGIKPLIYMSASVVNAYDWSVVANADYGLWIAGYPDLRSSWDLPDFCYSTGAWKFYALWQFTNSHGSLDRDVFTGDKKAWRLYAKVYEKKTSTPERAELLVERELVDYAKPKASVKTKKKDEEQVEVKVKSMTKPEPKPKTKSEESVEVEVRTKAKTKAKAEPALEPVKKVAKPAKVVSSVKENTEVINGETYYLIQKGDTLSQISLRFHTDIMTLCIWNGIMDPDLIYAGDKIRVK